jgi:hypothetical protein
MRSVLVIVFVGSAAPAFAQNAEDHRFCKEIATHGQLSYPDCMTMMGVSRYNSGQQTAPPSSHIAREPVPIAPQAPTNCIIMPLAGGMSQIMCN